MTTNQVHYFDQPQPGEVLVAIWSRGHDPLDSLIKLFTHGRGTHAAFIRGNGNIIENFYPRVRERGWMPGERGKVEEYRIAGSTPEDWAMLESWFDSQLKHPPTYSIADLFRFALNMKPKPDAACFCSAWVLRGIRLNLSPCKQPLARLEHPDWGSPRDLRISPLLHRKKKSCQVAAAKMPEQSGPGYYVWPQNMPRLRDAKTGRYKKRKK